MRGVPAIDGWSRKHSKRETTVKPIEIGPSIGVAQDQADLDRCPYLKVGNLIVDTYATVHVDLPGGVWYR